MMATQPDQPPIGRVPPLKDLNRFQVAVPDNKPRAELDGFRVKIPSRSLVKNKVEPLSVIITPISRGKKKQLPIC